MDPCSSEKSESSISSQGMRNVQLAVTFKRFGVWYWLNITQYAVGGTRYKSKMIKPS